MVPSKFANSNTLNSVLPHSLNLAAEALAPATGWLGTKQGTGREQAGKQGTMKYYYSRGQSPGSGGSNPSDSPEQTS